jgi:AcrR family transcriptional regulator
MVKYAHAEDDRKARRDSILGAALTLFLVDTRRLPAVSAIATTAGLAKGTVYLYFETKEQIFAALLAREWDDVLFDVEASFVEDVDDRSVAVDRFIDRFSIFLSSHPYFLRLDSLGYGHLEANLPADEYWRFKNAFSAALNRSGAAADQALSLPAGHGVRLLMRSYALARGLWQTLDLPDRLKGDSRYEEHPLAGIDFDTELRTALSEYWLGALARVP